MRKLVSIVGVLCAVVLVPFALAAQQTATTPVTIRVSDPTGAVIPHAQIRLVPAPDPVPGRLETDDQGQFSINLKTGGYALTVSAQGFKNWVEHIYIHAPESHAVASQSVPLVLDVGATFSPTVIAPPESLVLTAYPNHAPVVFSPSDFAPCRTSPSPCTTVISTPPKPTPESRSPPCWPR